MARLNYFIYSLLPGIIGTIIPTLVTNAAYLKNIHPTTLGLMFLVVNIICLYSLFVLIIKRLHDLNNNGWWSILIFIPFVNIAFAIYLLFFRGTKEPNRFGNPPA